HAVDDAIGGRYRTQPADPGKARQSPHHRWPDLCGIDDPCTLRAQPEHEDLSDEIHAVPALFGEIGHNGDSGTPASNVHAASFAPDANTTPAADARSRRSESNARARSHCARTYSRPRRASSRAASGFAATSRMAAAIASASRRGVS